MHITGLIQARATGAAIVAVLLCMSGTAAHAASQQKLTRYHRRASSSATAPAITAEPASRTVTAGQTANFSVTASGTAPLTYQWRMNGTAISGATSSSYTTPATTISENASQFTVVVSNSAGSATSTAAVLTVNAAASILDSSAASLAFGSVNVSSSNTQSVTLTNAGKLQRDDFERHGGGSGIRRERCVVRVDSIERAERGAECDSLIPRRVGARRAPSR